MICIQSFAVLFVTLGLILGGQSEVNEAVATPGLECRICHLTTDWTDLTEAQFDHSETAFPLLKSHKLVSCASCHTGATLQERHNFSQANSECSGCHVDIHQGLLGNDCQRCHQSDIWQSVEQDFQHELSRFPLSGRHAALDCNQCHTSLNRGIVDGLSPVCADCHQDARQLADGQVSDHSFFPDNCTQCHDQIKWQPAFFDHQGTGFPLLGMHQTADCADCHNGSYEDTPTGCEICHISEYGDTQAPSHALQVYLITDCQKCHNPAGWIPSIYSHQPTPESCSLCHTADLINANLQITGHSGLSNNCQICHGTEAWSELQFEHSITGFTLNGIHQSLDCEKCHTAGYFAELPQECYGCHSAEFESTTQPNHVLAGFDPADCHLCHSTLGWEPAEYDHDGNLDCLTCHDTNGSWDPTPLIDHNSAPKLGTAIDDCELCHSTASWLDISFSNNGHDGSVYSIYFDIYSGEHQNEWGNSCSNNCHVFGSFNTFSCYDNCHSSEHSQSEMQDEHCDGINDCETCSQFNGYWNVSVEYMDGNWGSPATFNQCYQCHPDGDKDSPCSLDRIKPFNDDTKFLPAKHPKGAIK